MLRLKGQKSGSDCAVACVQNALWLKGRNVGRSRIINALGGDLSLGIDTPDVRRALDSLGVRWEECDTSEPAVARGWLTRLSSQFPLMLCTRDWNHWELVTGRCGARVCLHDPETGPAWPSLRWLFREWPARKTTPRRVGAPGAGIYHGFAFV